MIAAVGRVTNRAVRLSVDIRDWLDANGNPVPALRRRALRIARLIEYGGPLDPGQTRETLVECACRPSRKACPGLLWVSKTADHRLEAHCLVCRGEYIAIAGWQETDWADGPMEPVDLDQLPGER